MKKTKRYFDNIFWKKLKSSIYFDNLKKKLKDKILKGNLSFGEK